VVIRSQQYPNGEISGTLGCVGTCTTPPNISGSNPCAYINGQLQIYGDSLNTTLGWADWSWGTTRNFSYTLDKVCGNDSLNSLFGDWGAIALHAGNGGCNPGQCTQNWETPYISISGYEYFQFEVKSPTGPIPTPIVLSAENSTGGAVGPGLTVTFNYIDNFVVEETWTRVKVPLSALGFKGTELVGVFEIQLQADLSNFQLLVDNIRLVPSYTDPLTTAPIGTVHSYSVAC